MPYIKVLLEQVDRDEQLLADVTSVLLVGFDDHSLGFKEPTPPTMLTQQIFCLKAFVAVVAFVEVVSEHGLPLANEGLHLGGEVWVTVFFIEWAEPRLDLFNLFI